MRSQYPRDDSSNLLDFLEKMVLCTVESSTDLEPELRDAMTHLAKALRPTNLPELYELLSRVKNIKYIDWGKMEHLITAPDNEVKQISMEWFHGLRMAVCKIVESENEDEARKIGYGYCFGMYRVSRVLF